MIDRTSSVSPHYHTAIYGQRRYSTPQADDVLPSLDSLSAQLAALLRAENMLRAEAQRLRRLIRPQCTDASLVSDDEAYCTGERVARMREQMLALHDGLRRLRLDVQQRRQ